MEEVSNFYDLISEKTNDFVGREWVFKEIDKWLYQNSQNRFKYFIITGKAGSGKSTIAARLIEISNGLVKGNVLNDNNEQDTTSFKKIKKDFLDAFYVISFKDNLSTDAKTLARSLSSQLFSKDKEFALELSNSIQTSNNYNININASQQQVQAGTAVYGGNFNFDIRESSSALSVFNALFRTPLESYLKKYPEKRILFLIDGLDESITSSSKEETYSENIISILSNLKALKNVYFIVTTRDYENILNKLKDNSLILDISSGKYNIYINDDVLSFIQLNINKKLRQKFDKEKFTEYRVNQLVEKAEGNFLYIKFVMDSIVEGKIDISEEEVTKMPSGLFGMYNLFFDRMISQYGDNNWSTLYMPIIRTLLVSFESLDLNQLSFFTGIEDNLQQILIDLKPFIVVQKLSNNTSKTYNIKYKLYHQSLVEFLKKEYLDDDSHNSFYISEQRGHKKILEKYYDKDNEKFKLNLLKEYGLRYLPDHLFALSDYDDPEGIDWYTKLLELIKDSMFEEKQRQFFPFETNLPLQAIKRAYEASLEKDDPISTVEMLLLYSANLKEVFIESPLSILTKNNNIDNDDLLEKSWRIADLYDKETRIKWYLSIAWYLDYKNKKINAKKTLNRLFEKELVTIHDSIINFYVYTLYEHYKDNIVKIFNYLSNENIYKISLFFFKNNYLTIGLEIFNCIRNKKSKINDKINDLTINKEVTENSLITEIIEKSNILASDILVGYNSLDFLSSIAQLLAQSNRIEDAIKIASTVCSSSDKSKILASIAQSLAQSNRIDEAIKASNIIDDHAYGIQILASIAQLLIQSNRIDEATKLFDEAIKIANTIDNIYLKSKALSSIAQSLAQSLAQYNRIDEAIEVANIIDDKSYSKAVSLSSIAQSLARSNRIDEAIKIANTIDDHTYKIQILASIAQSLAQSNKIDEAIKIANTIDDDIYRTHALSSIAQSLAQSNKIDEAIKIANTIDDKSYGKPNTLSSISELLAQSNRIDEAIKIANTIDNNYFKSKALSSISELLAQSNRIDEATKLFDEAINIATKIINNNFFKAIALSKIAELLAQSNRIDEATKLFDEAINIANILKGGSFRPFMLYYISAFLARSNKPNEAIKIANTIDDHTYKIHALSIIAQSLAQSNRIDEATKLFDEAINIATKIINNNFFKAIALSKIAESLAQSNRIDEAIKIANTIDERYGKQNTLSSIAELLVQSNRIDEAIKIANTIDDHTDRIQILASIAQLLIQSNRIDEATKLFDEAIKYSDYKYPFEKSTALSIIAQSLAQSNRIDEATKLFDEAIKIANTIDNNYLKSKALSIIAQSLAQSNRIDEAIKIANKLDDESQKAALLVKIIVMKSGIKDNFSKTLLELTISFIRYRLYEMSISSLKTQGVWNYIMKLSIGYPEIAPIICSFVAERYPKYSKELANLILLYNF